MRQKFSKGSGFPGSMLRKGAKVGAFLGKHRKEIAKAAMAGIHAYSGNPLAAVTTLAS